MTTKRDDTAIIELISDMMTRMDERFDQVDERLDRHDVRLDAIDARLDRHDSRFDSIEATLREHSLQLAKLQETVDDIAGEQQAHAQDITEIYNILVRYEKGAALTEQELAKTQQQLTDLIKWAEQVGQKLGIPLTARQ
jgi:chromosome segregation ATPase